MALWDAAQYDRFADERSRPFVDLIARIPVRHAVRHAADLGCGPGRLTQTLLARWPEATITGVDNSPEMLGAAAKLARDGHLAFIEADLASWQPGAALDVIVSNAALHWVPNHAKLLPRLVAMLAPGGVIAVQVPYNHDEPCHAIYDELRADPLWTVILGAAARQYSTESPGWYGATLLGLQCKVDLWETVYHHRLAGHAAIVEWVKGSLLRPTLERLDAERQKTFLAQYLDRIRSAYAIESGGAWLRYRRLFFVAQRPL